MSVLSSFRASTSRLEPSSYSSASAVGLKQTPIVTFLTGYTVTTPRFLMREKCNILLAKVEKDLQMSFTDDDKEALGEDLDEIKSNLQEIKFYLHSSNRKLGTLVVIGISFWLMTLIGLIGWFLILTPS